MDALSGVRPAAAAAADGGAALLGPGALLLGTNRDPVAPGGRAGEAAGAALTLRRTSIVAGLAPPPRRASCWALGRGVVPGAWKVKEGINGWSHYRVTFGVLDIFVE